jgi:hypothetical protein
MRTLQRNPKPFKVYNKTTSAVVTGLVLSDFTLYARNFVYGATAPASFTHNATIVADGVVSGLYWIIFDMPPVGPAWGIFAVPTNANYVCNPEWFFDELQVQDFDSLYSGLARASVSDPVSVGLGSIQGVEVTQYRRNQFNLVIKQGNQTVDLTTYTNLTVAIRSLDQSSVELDATNGVGNWTITGDNIGNLTVIMPASTGTALSPADVYGTIQTGQTINDQLYWEVSGYVAGDSNFRGNIIRSSPFFRLRREYGS